MWLNRLFLETPIDFEKRCRNRIILGICWALLGIVTLLLAFAAPRIPVLYLEPGWRDSVRQFYSGIGTGLLAAGILLVVRNLRYQKEPARKRAREIYETDERNRMLGLRCWAYAGYSMFLFLYVGILISGFISLTAMRVLMAVMAVFGLLMLVFRRVLQKSM